MMRLRHRPPPQRLVAAPSVGGLAILTCHFNFAGYTRPRQNLVRFCRQMQTMGVPVYGAEAYFIGTDPFTRTWDNWIQIPVHPRQLVFQKEALLQLLVQDVPKVHQHLAWVDADVWFGNPNWRKQAEEMLEVFKIIQLFSVAHWTDIDGRILESKRSCVDVGMTEKWHMHPGFAWASRRDVLEKVGLFQFAPLGHADTMMACTFMDQPLLKGGAMGLGRDVPESHFRKWEAVAKPEIAGSVGYIGGDLYHEWHGHRQKRSYYERGHLLKEFVSHEHIKLANNGLLEWTTQAPTSMIKAVAGYFPSRQEDGP